MQVRDLVSELLKHDLTANVLVGIPINDDEELAPVVNIKRERDPVVHAIVQLEIAGAITVTTTTSFSR